MTGIAAFAAARSALWLHGRSALVVALTAAAGMTAGIATGGTTGLGYASVRDGGWSVVWSGFVRAPAATQQAAVESLAGLVRGVALAALGVAAVSLLVLSVARAVLRRTDVQIRRAVGGSRGALGSAALLEGAALALAASALGLATGLVGSRRLAAGWPGLAVPDAALPLPVVLAAALPLVVVAGAMFTMVHARRRSTLPGSGGEELWLPVPVLQLGVSVAILGLAAQLAEGATSRRGAAAVPDEGGLRFAVTPAARTAAERAEVYGRLLAHLGAPTRRVSLTSPGVEIGLGPVDLSVTDCGQCGHGGIVIQHHSVAVVHHLASADTFRSMRFRIVAGRGIGPGDGWTAPRVAVVNRTLAAGHFEAGAAVGRQMYIGRGPEEWYRVVGIVDDPAPAGFGGGIQPRPAVYLSVLQHPPATADLDVSPVGDPQETLSEVRQALGAGAEVMVLPAASALRAAELVPARWFARVARVEGWAALLVAAFGMFAVMRLWIGALLAELAVRRAVGASRRRVLALVMARALGVVVAGAVVAWWLGPMISDAAARIVPGLPPWELRRAVGPLTLLAGLAILGGVWPAWRAIHASPASWLGRAGS